MFFKKKVGKGARGEGKNLRSIFIIIIIFFFSFPFPPSQGEAGHSGQQLLGFSTQGRAVSRVTSSLHAWRGFVQPGCLRCIPSHERCVPKDGGTWPLGTCWHRALLRAVGMLGFPHCRGATCCVVVPNGLQPACCAWRRFSFWTSSHPPPPQLCFQDFFLSLFCVCWLCSVRWVQPWDAAAWLQPRSMGTSSS